MSDDQNSVSDLLEDNQYKYGFTTDVESETFAKGLNEEVVRAISKKKKEIKKLKSDLNKKENELADTIVEKESEIDALIDNHNKEITSLTSFF